MESRISRRTLLRRTATLTTGVVVAGSTTFAAAHTAQPETPQVGAPDHDPATGEIFDRDRHHRWDSV